MSSQPPPLLPPSAVSPPWWITPAADQPTSSRFNWSAIVASTAVSFALIVSVVAWIVTHPHKSARPVEAPKVVALAPAVETTVALPAPPAAPSPPVVATTPAFHHVKQPEVVVRDIPLIEDTPPPLPPPSLPAATEPKCDAKPPVVEAAPAAPVGETYGTSVLFLNNPAVANDRARRDHKLLFVMHISGNFEDACFT